MKDKKIGVLVTGGIAAYKVVDVVSKLKKKGVQVYVAMTAHGASFVAPLTFQAISGLPVYLDTYEMTHDQKIAHIFLGQEMDLLLVAPATANIIGKAANGIADDLVSTTLMAANKPVLFCPAMNTAMYENPVVQENLKRLKERGMMIMEPGVGAMATKTEKAGAGRLPEPVEILERIEAFFKEVE